MLFIEQVVIALILILSVVVLTFTSWILISGAGSAMRFIYKSIYKSLRGLR